MNKLISLFKSGQTLYHTQDLAILWSIQNRHTLRVTISRYIKRGLLFSVTKGLYSTIPTKEIDQYYLGSILIHRYSYLSCESILEEHGVINQKVFSLNYISSVSRKIELGERLYVYRQMVPEFLFNPEGITFVNGIYKASLERAVADCEYFGLNLFFDSQNLIDFKKMEKIKRIVKY